MKQEWKVLKALPEGAIMCQACGDKAATVWGALSGVIDGLMVHLCLCDGCNGLDGAIIAADRLVRIRSMVSSKA